MTGSLFATGESPADLFRVGFRRALREYDASLPASVRFNAATERDAMTIHLGPVYVTVSGLELIGAANPYVLGAAKARELIDRYTAPGATCAAT